MCHDSFRHDENEEEWGVLILKEKQMDTTLLDDTDLRKKWYQMSVEKQIGNIGSEVNRAI